MRTIGTHPSRTRHTRSCHQSNPPEPPAVAGLNAGTRLLETQSPLARRTIMTTRRVPRLSERRMRQDGTAGSMRAWAVRLLMVFALAVCAGAVRAPIHSPTPMPSVSSIVTSSAGDVADAGAGSGPAVRADAGGNVAAVACVEQAHVEATGPGGGCDCCCHDVATCCAATSEDASPLGCLGSERSGEHEPPAVVTAGVAFHLSWPVPPSLSELSLLRI